MLLIFGSRLFYALERHFIQLCLHVHCIWFFKSWILSHFIFVRVSMLLIKSLYRFDRIEKQCFGLIYSKRFFNWYGFRISEAYSNTMFNICDFFVLFVAVFHFFNGHFEFVCRFSHYGWVTITSLLYIHNYISLLLLVTRLGSAWHVSSTHIVAPYRSFSREKIPGTVGAYIGLMQLNITLKGKNNFSFGTKVNFCEFFPIFKF